MLMESPALLHNMSAPSRTTIAHQAPRGSRSLMVFRLPDGEWTPSAVLERLDGTAWAGSPEDAERELRLRINRHALTLPYPPAALLGGRPADATGYASNFLTICAVLAKSSTRVYLRDKEPNLSNLSDGRIALMHFPEMEAPND
jgi:hypothetical protein